MKKQCKFCGQEFDGRADKEFCSKECINKFAYRLKKNETSERPSDSFLVTSEKPSETLPVLSERPSEMPSNNISDQMNKGFNKPSTMTEDWYNELLDANLRASEIEVKSNKRIAELEYENKYNNKCIEDLGDKIDEYEERNAKLTEHNSRLEEQNRQMAEQNKMLAERLERMQTKQNEMADLANMGATNTQPEPEPESNRFSIGFSN